MLLDTYYVAGDNSSPKSYNRDPIIITERYTVASDMLKVAKMKFEPGNTILEPRLSMAVIYVPVSMDRFKSYAIHQ